MIQIDMFEVQLGASILLQFKIKEGKIIRVLADAGVGPGLPTDHVHRKLTAAFDYFGGQDRRIDLIIGTHYDADHLDGLVPIIEDKGIEIQEVWLPPVANDTEPHSFDEHVGDRDFLAIQFYGDDHRRRLLSYLEEKRGICERLRPRDAEGDNKHRSPELKEDNIEGALELFKKYRDEATPSVGPTSDSLTHADDERFNPAELKELLRLVDEHHFLSSRFLYREWVHYDPDAFLADITKTVAEKSTVGHNLAWIRRAAAEDAINAISLEKVVAALRARCVPIFCRTIPDGVPQPFVWRTKSRRFERGDRLPAQGPVIVLCGPSEGLVRKHWNRLPIGTYGAIAAFALIPIKNITPSNQLSYVARFEAEGQRILITGDAGCVDFKPNRSSRHYYQKLLDTLRPLHVVQVAHHAGNNAHFYRVLAAAKYFQQNDPSFLLVSHATHDSHRPSREFSQFVQGLRREREVAKILFTTEPRPDKVRDFKSLVYPVIGTAGTKGDACLLFQRGAWKVAKHAIRV